MNSIWSHWTLVTLMVTFLCDRALGKCDAPRSWECASKKECIANDLLCDGLPHCADGSDETFSICSNYTCPGYTFKCSYGACVDGDASCNGVTDCIDKSDELLPQCKGVKSQLLNHNCKKLEFACLDGKQCISIHDWCDGVPNCIDRSDESITQCSQNSCPPYSFRCAYGACVDGDAPCNSIQECADNSDEFAPQCNVTGPSYLTIPDASLPPSELVPNGPGGKCIVPAPPLHGSFSSITCEDQSGCRLKQGMKVGGGFDIEYFCHSGFKLLGVREQRCTRAGWSPPGPRPLCSDECEPLTSSRLDILCFRFDHSPTKCKEKMSAGSYVRFNCKTAIYRKVTEPGYDKLVCRNGEWDRPLPGDMCQPACGREVLAFAEPVVVHGKAVEGPAFPWHTGIYQYKNDSNEGSNGFELICGGSLLSTKLVLTAAHCIRSFNSERLGVDTSPNLMRVAMGKLFRALYNREKDRFEQVFEIKATYVSGEYSGEYGNYANDIAMIELKTSVIYTVFVLPVCLDLGRQNIEETQLTKGSYGKVAGWGLTENKVASERLLVAEMPLVPSDICRRDTDLYNYITYDKICAGDIKSNVTVCKGDSGGGLVFKHPTSNEYYLRGVVSAGSEDCTGEDFSLFTRISKHKDFIEQFLIMKS